MMVMISESPGEGMMLDDRWGTALLCMGGALLGFTVFGKLYEKILSPIERKKYRRKRAARRWGCYSVRRWKEGRVRA